MKIDWFANMPAATTRIAPPPVAAGGEVAPAKPRDAMQWGGTYTVVKRDTLWDVAARVLGDANRWPEVFALNRDKVKDPDLILPGTVLKLPGLQRGSRPTEAAPEQPTTPTSRPPVRQAPVDLEAELDQELAVRPRQPQVVDADVPDTAAMPYPTVGEYVKGRVNDAVDSTVDTLHGAAEIVLPPLLLGEIAAIKARHQAKALERIWTLPMDPQGKWKIEAKRISDQESALASAEIRQLPGIRAMSAAGEAIGEGVVWTGRQISRGANAVLDGVVATGEAIGEGVQWTGRQIELGAQAVGRGARIAGEAVVDGAVWVGTQAVEVPKAAARTTVRGIGGIGEMLTRFSQWALGGLD